MTSNACFGAMRTSALGPFRLFAMPNDGARRAVREGRKFGQILGQIVGTSGFWRGRGALLQRRTLLRIPPETRDLEFETLLPLHSKWGGTVFSKDREAPTRKEASASFFISGSPQEASVDVSEVSFEAVDLLRAY